MRKKKTGEKKEEKKHNLNHNQSINQNPFTTASIPFPPRQISLFFLCASFLTFFSRSPGGVRGAEERERESYNRLIRGERSGVFLWLSRGKKKGGSCALRCLFVCLFVSERTLRCEISSKTQCFEREKKNHR